MTQPSWPTKPPLLLTGVADVAEISGFTYEGNASANQAASEALNGSQAEWQTQAHVDTQKAATDTYVAGDGSGSTGQTFTLTTSADDISNAVNVNAPVAVAPQTGTNVQTLNSTDKITGSAGTTDTLTAVLNNTEGAGVTPTMSGIENLKLTATASSIFSGANSTGIKAVEVSGAALANLVVRDLAELTSVAVSGTDDDADLTVMYNNDVVSGTADEVTLNLSGVGAGTPSSAVYTNNINIRGNTAGGVETLNVVTSGSASRINSLGSDASVINGAITDDSVVSTINVSGDQDLTIENELYGVEMLDASTFTGKLNVTFTDDTGDAKDVTVTGGTGDDSIDFLTGLDKDDTVVGGDGADTLGVMGANGVTLGSTDGAIKVSGVETLAILGNTAGNSTLDFDVFTNPTEFTTVSVEGADTNNRNVTLTDVQAATYTLLNSDNGGGGTANDLGNITIDLKDSDGLADNITVNLITDDQDADFVITEVDAQGIELMTLDASTEDSDADDDITVGTLDGDALTALTITGNADLTITNALDNLVKNVDGSAASGDLNITAGVAEFNGKGGSGDDTFTSAGANFTDGTAGTSFTGNGGEDTFKFEDADAGITGANLTTAAASTTGGLNEVLTITDFNAGSGSASGTVDKIDLSGIAGFNEAGGTVNVVNGGAVQALSGLDLGAAVDALLGAGTLLDATATDTFAGLFSFGGDTFFIASSSDGDQTDGLGAVNDATNADIIINVTGISGTLDASDIII